jgi:RNA polymerase sigma-70 factor (ECF subfamily)
MGMRQMTDRTDPALDPSSDDAIFATIYPALHRFACVVCPPEADPDDLVQDATARALRRGPLSELDHPTAYLRRAIANLASNERRRLGRQRRALTIVGRAPDVDPTYASDVAELLSLPPGTRAVLWLAEVEGATYDEIAELLGCTPEAARARASRARKQLRHLIDGARHEEDVR